MEKYLRFSKLPIESRYAVALSGAWISVERGIPDFRSSRGPGRKRSFGIRAYRFFAGKCCKGMENAFANGRSDGRCKSQPKQAHPAPGELERPAIIRMAITGL